MGFWAQHSDGFSDASVLGLRRLGISLASMASPHSKLSDWAKSQGQTHNVSAASVPILGLD